MNLIRLLMIQMEGGGDEGLSKYTEEEQAYHAALLIEAGLIDGAIVKNHVGFPTGASLIRLTWQGHEFIDAARNKTIWEEAGGRLQRVAGGMPFAVLQELLKAMILKAAIGI